MVTLRADTPAIGYPNYETQLREAGRIGDVLLAEALKASTVALNSKPKAQDRHKIKKAIDALAVATRASKAARDEHKRHAREHQKQAQLAADEKRALAAARNAIFMATKRVEGQADALTGLVYNYKPPSRSRTPVLAIAEQICAAYNYTVKDILSGNRDSALSYVRQEIMYEAHAIEGHAKKHIGRALDRNHATVAHGIRAHKKRIEAAKQ